MIAKFKKWIIHCMNYRTDEILDQMAVGNKAFRRLTRELTPLIDAVKDKLPDEYKHLLEEMDDIRGKRDFIVYKTLYRQGVKDGIRLFKMTHGCK